MLRSCLAQTTLLLLCASCARADVILLLEEPFGGFFSGNPAHSAIYLPWACAESPTLLRRCNHGEEGAVISRYHRIEGYDWVAIPLIPYLYAVENETEAPRTASAELVADLRDKYRTSHLESVAPDQDDGQPPRGDWRQLVGEAYDRTIYGFRIQTPPDQDDALLRELNAQPNRNQFNIVFRNCADFAQRIINFYFPYGIHRAFFPDFEIMTPRQLATSLVRYSQGHPELAFSTFMIPQVPGTMRRSKAIRGFLSTLQYPTLEPRLATW